MLHHQRAQPYSWVFCFAARHFFRTTPLGTEGASAGLSHIYCLWGSKFCFTSFREVVIYGTEWKTFDIKNIAYFSQSDCENTPYMRTYLLLQIESNMTRNT